MVNCSSSGLQSRSRASPNTWSSGMDRQVRVGAPFCATTHRILLHGSVHCPDPWLRPALCLHHHSTKPPRLVWINVTTNPTAEWIARQITEAFPWNEAPRYLVRDRDQIYGTIVTRRLRAMGIRDKPIAPASPWQNGFAERLIGSIRRECVDHFIVLGEAHLRHILRTYARYYNHIRTHWSLDKDTPVYRPVQRIGSINSHAILGGLHHHNVRVYFSVHTRVLRQDIVV